MAVPANRVAETTTTEGTGTYDLLGASSAHQSFVSGVGTGQTVRYCAFDQTDWEVGEGVVTDLATDTLTRATIFDSSNSGSAVVWTTGTRDIVIVHDSDSIQDILNHVSSTSNPHSVTQTQVGLSNVDNTSDANKPVSTAQQTALDGKIDDAQVLTNVPAGALFTDTVYSHPSHPGDDFALDTTLLSGATVVSDIDINVTTDTSGHVTDANGVVATRELTLANLGYTGSATANDYTHPGHPGDDFSVDTGLLSGATVVSDIDINVTTDSSGHVTDANGVVATRTLTLANLGYTGETNATADQTAAQILSSLKTVDVNGTSGVNAGTFDALLSTQFLRSDANDTITGDTQWASGKSPYVYDSPLGGRISAPGGAAYLSNRGGHIGAIKIVLPIGSADMISFEVKIFDFAADESLTLLISGYLSGGSYEMWHNTSVTTLTSNTTRDYMVRFGGDGSNSCIWIGETTSTWSYLQIGVFNFIGGYSTTTASYASGWDITIETAFDRISNTKSTSLPAAQTATKLATARTIDITGDITATAVSFDGTANIAISAAVNNNSHTHNDTTIDGLDASATTTGTFADARIPSLNTSKLTAGTLPISRGGTGNTTGDAATLDSINSTSFLRSDATDVKTAGHLTFNDSIYARFGTGADTEMYHNGTQQYMDLTTGNYYIRDAATTRFTFTRTTGDFTATGNVTAYSDERIKENIEVIPDALDKIEKLSGYTFDRTDIDVPRQTGVIAQEVEKVLPEAVTDGDIKSVAYGNMAGLFIEAIKELNEKIDSLQKEVSSLKVK